MPKIQVPGYSLNQVQLYSGLYTMIYSGTRNDDHADVVIKILKNEHPSPDDIVRFRHEYEIAKDFETEADIVHVSALEKHDNSYAIVMENIHAPTLEEILAKEKKLKVTDFLELAIRMTEALGHIHQHNIIHKDINPSNIMCNFLKKEIKIIDFGLSANLPKEMAEILSPNVLEGTLTYLSPEQTGRMNRGIDYRTDYYSLGVTFYNMLTGQLPFVSKDPMELVHYHIAVVPKSPYDLDKSIPKVISDIIMKLLAKKAEDRYQNTNGLLADLKECLEQWKQTGKILPFTLGRNDIFSRFQIPEKLYGRDKEVNTLMKTYDSVMSGKVELMLVAGYSGIGKSVLVHEVHKPIVAKHGYFITGKFDQFKHNIPYAAITQAFDEFVKQILTEPEEHIAVFRKKILEAVGENGKIIIDVIPNLLTIIGEQPEVPTLGPTESLNRFSYVFQKFIKSLSAAKHPLVIFLDDLQWVDLPSLKLLETLLTSQDCQYLFIIGAYRSNEVNPTHPLMISLEELKKRSVQFNTIELGPLQFENVTELLADTLHQNPDQIQQLSQICYEKTGGNPFFLIQMLLTLYKEQLIEFDVKSNRWTWKIDKIKEKDISANVVDLMVNKLSELSKNTQKSLQFASCIGNKFTLDLLAHICKQDPETVILELQEALKEGYVIVHGESYRATEYHFAHDRIQQAAHSMLSQEERNLIHINLARLLLKLNKNHVDEVIFDVANHYDLAIEHGIPQAIDAKELIKIIELNLQAAKAAKAAAAFEPAFKYLEYGMKCSNQQDWGAHYDLMLNLYVEAAEIAYLNTKFELMDKYIDIGLKNSKDVFDKIKFFKTKIYSYIVQNKQRDAVDTAVEVLKELDVNINIKSNMMHILLAILKTKIALIGKSIPSLLNLPVMTEPYHKSAINLMAMSASAAYQAYPNLLPIFTTNNIIFSVRYGNTKDSAYSYALFGLLLCGVLEDYEAGYQFGELGYKVMEKLHVEEDRTRINFMNFCFIKHWKEHLHSIIPKLNDNFEQGLESGDTEYASYSCSVYSSSILFAGLLVKDYISKLEKFRLRVINVGNVINANYTSSIIQAMKNLTKNKKDPWVLKGETFDEDVTLPQYLQTNDKTGLGFFYAPKVLLCSLFENYVDGQEFVKKFELFYEGVLSQFHLCVVNLHKALMLLAIYQESPAKTKLQIKYEVNKCLKKAKKWSKFCPSNHLHKYYLIQAEKAWRIDSQNEKAAKLFDLAIKTAKENDFINEEAIANELAAKFYLAQDNEKIARVYMEDARHCYLLWGADAKVEFLNDRYPQLLRASTVSSYVSTTVSTAASDRAASQVLDISTIQKSSQAISSTIVLADLLKRLMRIVIENAGAQKSYLLLHKKKKYLIEAEGDVDQPEVQVLQSIEPTPDKLPTSIINYVIHAKESVVLDNASSSERFMNDVYIIDKKPKSVLCMPLLNQGILTGILYMENNLTEGAFTEDRIRVLDMLSSQIAISIDNARLYSNTKSLNEQLIILNNAYERFVPQDFLSLLEKKSIVDVSLGDQVQETMSVLFTDIRNFTTISETMSPEDNFKFINSFLSVMAPVIRKYNGFVDKYIGDAIMALYPKDADDAVQCALEMQHALREYNQARTDKGKDPIGIGIGINTGLLMLGTVGETNRMNATVISDTVNIASRIESLTKSYKVPILISEDTYKSLKNPARYHIEMVDNQVLVKGKTKTIAVYKVEEA